ncbi:MAG: hypothetical protein MR303_04870 [Emergencia sp.]|nr:hypothetical protein [Emergencia sp.]
MEQSIDVLIQKLQDGQDMLNTYWKALEVKYGSCGSKERKKTVRVLWLLIQNAIFSNEPLDKKELAMILGISVSAAHGYVENLIKSGAPIIIEKESRKLVYRLQSAALLDFLYS